MQVDVFYRWFVLVLSVDNRQDLGRLFQSRTAAGVGSGIQRPASLFVVLCFFRCAPTFVVHRLSGATGRD